MQALVEYSRGDGACYGVELVVSDRPEAPGLALARDLRVATRAVPVQPAEHRSTAMDRGQTDAALAAVIERCNPALIVLAGYMRILSAEFVERYAGRILNIHPSLLPRYPGLHTHRKVLAAGDAIHGATVHFVTPELDAGPGIIQGQVAVECGDDEASLAARVLAIEHRIYPLAVRWYCEGRLRHHSGCAWLDGKALSGPVIYDAAAAPLAPTGPVVPAARGLE